MKTTRLAKPVVAFASGLALAACIVQAQPNDDRSPALSEPGAAAPARSSSVAAGGAIEVPDGNYSCTIGGYDPFPCRVATEKDGRKRLEKLAGSQRFSGIISTTANGFQFRGTYYCPFGDCTEAVTGDFIAYDDGLYRGKLSTAREPTTVTVQYTQYGGAGYGGGRYGAMLYGGVGYGY